MENGSDIVIIGGGIVGLATAYNLALTQPGRSIRILEKESTVAQHQTGHNSGVLHSGIYYKPGSLKARNCRVGIRAMKEFCEREGITYETCGKVIVATADSELPRLQTLFERGQANGVQCELIDRPRLLELEPHCAGIKAIHVPEAGIVNYTRVCERLQELIESHGHQVETGALVTNIRETESEVILTTPAGEFRAKNVVNCAGLHSDRVTALGGTRPSVKILPFRGEYYELNMRAEHLCRTLIYPVPDPQFPFLGVHLTKMIAGGVHCGPNAVLALAREGYRKTDVNLRDLSEALSYPGFLKLAARHWRMGADEMWRSFSKGAFVRALQRLVPEIKASDLIPSPAGVRAQAVAADGRMVDDFAIDERKRIINVLNAPSPAATASLSVGRMIAERVTAHF